MNKLIFAVVGCIAIFTMNGCKAAAPKMKESDTKAQQGHKAASSFAAQLDVTQFKGDEFGRPELQIAGNVKQIIFKDHRGETKFSFDKKGRLTSKIFSDETGSWESVYLYQDEKLVSKTVVNNKGKTTFSSQLVYGEDGDLKKEIINATDMAQRILNYRYEISGRLQKVILESGSQPPIVRSIDDKTGQIVSMSESPNMISFDPTSSGFYTNPNVVTSYFSCVAYRPPFSEKCLIENIEGNKQWISKIVIRDAKTKLPITEFSAMPSGLYWTYDSDYQFDDRGSWIKRDIRTGKAKIRADGEPGQRTLDGKIRTEYRRISYYD